MTFSGSIIRRDTLVMKFGGTSVGTPDAMRQDISIVQTEKPLWKNLIIVTSALSRVTDTLIRDENLRQTEAVHPQPHLDRSTGKGMATVVGRVRPDPLLILRWLFSPTTPSGELREALFIKPSFWLNWVFFQSRRTA
jgi:hypothetical protein